MNTFYLTAQNTCVQHATIAGCETYHPNQEDRCTACSFDRILFAKNTRCLEVQLEGCEEYLSETECDKCQEGFMITN